MTVYIVTDGDYSDYQICGVFESESNAKEFIAAGGGRDVEPWEVGTWRKEQGTWSFTFSLKSGDLIEEKYRPALEETDECSAVLQWEPDVKPGDRANIRVEVERGDRARALKIATERLMRIRANWDDAAKLAAAYDPMECGLPLRIAEVLAGIAQSEDSGYWYDTQVRLALGLPSKFASDLKARMKS